jgi:hypothetical protein
VLQQIAVDWMLGVDGSGCLFEVHGVPQHDRCGEEVQPGCSVALHHEGAVTEFAKPVERVACFSFVEPSSRYGSC